jgi:hypothetical protein
LAFLAALISSLLLLGLFLCFIFCIQILL